MGGRPSSRDGFYWALNLHISKPPPPCNGPPEAEGLLNMDIRINRANLVVYLDEHGIPRRSKENSLHQITTPATLYFPAGSQLKRAHVLHRWLQSSHQDLIALLETDDAVTDFTDHVVERVFERVNLHDRLPISVTADLHRVSIEYMPMPIEPESDNETNDDDDDDDDDDDETDDDDRWSEYWVQGLSRFYVAEVHRRFRDCSICLEDLFPVKEEEERNKYVFRSPCGHVFHNECMTQWLGKRDSCPLCRFVVSSRIEQLLEEHMLLLGHRIEPTRVNLEQRETPGWSLMIDQADRSEEDAGSATHNAGYISVGTIRIRLGQQLVAQRQTGPLWSMETLPKIRAFLWRLSSNALAVRGNLVNRPGMDNIDARCPFCYDETETIQHMLFKCAWTARVWCVVMNARVDRGSISTVDQWLTDVSRLPGLSWMDRDKRWSLCGFVCWSIWKERCRALFEHDRPNPTRVAAACQRDHHEFWDKHSYQ